MTLSEDAAIDDSRLDIYSLEASGVIAALKLLPSLRAGTQGRWSEVRTLVGQEVLVETTKPRSVNADGEIVSQTPAKFRVVAGAVEIFAPAQYAGWHRILPLQHIHRWAGLPRYRVQACRPPDAFYQMNDRRVASCRHGFLF